jgi:hypothetical protein
MRVPHIRLSPGSSLRKLPGVFALDGKIRRTPSFLIAFGSGSPPFFPIKNYSEIWAG